MLSAGPAYLIVGGLFAIFAAWMFSVRTRDERVYEILCVAFVLVTSGSYEFVLRLRRKRQVISIYANGIGRGDRFDLFDEVSFRVEIRPTLFGTFKTYCLKFQDGQEIDVDSHFPKHKIIADRLDQKMPLSSEQRAQKSMALDGSVEFGPVKYSSEGVLLKNGRLVPLSDLRDIKITNHTGVYIHRKGAALADCMVDLTKVSDGIAKFELLRKMVTESQSAARAYNERAKRERELSND